MKFKKLIGGAVLAVVLGLGVGAGVASKQVEKVAPVDADDPKTAMFTMSLNAEALEEAYSTSNYRFHAWGTNINEYFSMHPTGQEHTYTVIVYLTSAQTVSGGQFVFYQSDGAYPGDKYSQDLNLFAEGSYVVDKDNNNGISFTWASSTDWDGDGHWAPTQRYAVPVPKLSHQATIGGAETWHNFILEPENKRYAIYDLEIAARYVDIIGFDYPSASASTYFHAYEMFNKYAREWTDETGGSSSWTYLDAAGTYDIFIENDFDGEGIISIKKHEDATKTFIYYVTNSDSATTDYIYSWGGSEQFGAFPGTSIASLVTAEKAKEVTNNGVLHFQGSETPKLIYEIEIYKGYPTGDLSFMFDNGTEIYKSDERLIQAEHAYWWSGPANHDAAQALNFLTYLEIFRNSATDTSICNINPTNISTILLVYNSFDQDVLDTYIDCSTIYTWTDSSKTANKLWSVKDVVAQLNSLYEASLTGSSGLGTINNHNQNQNNEIVIAMVVIVAVISITSLAVLVVLKKRKHN